MIPPLTKKGVQGAGPIVRNFLQTKDGWSLLLLRFFDFGIEFGQDSSETRRGVEMFGQQRGKVRR